MIISYPIALYQNIITKTLAKNSELIHATGALPACWRPIRIPQLTKDNCCWMSSKTI